MIPTRAALGAAAIAVAVALGGCGGASVEQYSSTVSKGQELTDLKRALDEGAINQQEYDRLRTAIVRRPN
jgi:hypothetical protein